MPWLQPVEIVLNGLAGVGADEEFTHEVIVPPEAKQHLEPGVLQVRTAHTTLTLLDRGRCG